MKLNPALNPWLGKGWAGAALVGLAEAVLNPPNAGVDEEPNTGAAWLTPNAGAAGVAAAFPNDGMALAVLLATPLAGLCKPKVNVGVFPAAPKAAVLETAAPKGDADTALEEKTDVRD